jgi:hypothetical protein
VGVLAEPSGRGYQLVVVDGTGMGIPEPWRVVRFTLPCCVDESHVCSVCNHLLRQHLVTQSPCPPPDPCLSVAPEQLGDRGRDGGAHLAAAHHPRRDFVVLPCLHHPRTRHRPRQRGACVPVYLSKRFAHCWTLGFCSVLYKSSLSANVAGMLGH